MGDLSKNFSKSEFVCPCCGQSKIDMRLIDALQDLRDHIGKPIRINSGYRCPDKNEAVNGVKGSKHLQGIAADIHVDGLHGPQLARAAESIPEFLNGGIGTGKNYIHVDVRGYLARWVY